jgi:endonuclease/exonuclease/phosphatase (EEP) superfamily protein YafD
VLSWGSVGVVVGLWLITGAGRSWRAPPALFVACVTFLPYLYGLVTAGVFAVWTILPDRRAPPALLVLIALSAAVLWGPSIGSTVRDGEPVRVMTWNVRRLWGPPDAIGTRDDHRRATACVVHAVAAVDPDVLVLLEVSAVDVASLSSRLNLSCVHGDYMGIDGDDLGGLAVCVRDERWRIRSGGPRRFVDDEDWYYAFAEIERDEHVFNVFAVHLQPYAFGTTAHRSGLDQGDPGGLIELGRHGHEVSRAQVDQAAALLDRMSKLRDPTVVLGDFNSTRDTSLHVALRGVLSDAWERGGRGFGATVRFFDRLPLRVDYAYVSDAFDVVGARVPEAGCSDHEPVVADLSLVDGRDPP